MSRYEVIHEDKGLAFGKDHACGEWLQIWRRPAMPDERRLVDEFGPDDEDMLVNKDTFFDKTFDKEAMVELIKEHGFSVSELEKAKNDTEDYPN